MIERIIIENNGTLAIDLVTCFDSGNNPINQKDVFKL